MCPTDRSPHGGEILHELPEPVFPDPQPSGEGAPPTPVDAAVDPDDPAQRRPAIPSHTELQAADIEDEEADPVVESGPGVDEIGPLRAGRA